MKPTLITLLPMVSTPNSLDNGEPLVRSYNRKLWMR